MTNYVNALTQHKKYKHNSCDQLDYSSSQSSNLKRHEERKHEEIQYCYDQCDYSTSYSVNLENARKADIKGLNKVVISVSLSLQKQGH